MLKIYRSSLSTKLQHPFIANIPLKINLESFIDENRNLGREEHCLPTKNEKTLQATKFSSLNNVQNNRKCNFSPNLLGQQVLTFHGLNLSQKRSYSVQSSIESFAQTQSGIFKLLSESPPVEYCQKFLLSIHDITGLPWWASIICSTVLVRTTITLPLAVYQQYILAKLENLKLELPDLVKELKKETAIAVRLYGWDEPTARRAYYKSLRKLWNNLIIRDNCHPLKTTILLWFQIPIWISLSVSLRNMVYMLPVPDYHAQLIFTEFQVGGFGFIPNLTIPDQSWIFPVALGLINLLIIEIQQLSRPPNLPVSGFQKFVTNAFRVFSVILVPISASVPSCLVLYWTTSSTYGLLQNLLLMSPKVKGFLRIPKTTAVDPYKTLLSNVKTRFKIS
ncbi:cytochrome c oxidase assembly protein COX18, mitochondrial [Sitophilus oryzae]|uniref:Cytochrome c oxidase assembly protein COX18, mitochondrial n=1 Tax=Sitophilus oryzae TaxID=7048 RepID=A0A6J2XL75_SITOR|nr:cytochrome c oxidase assembly protein COX18, mitochondrial [Sitophilus oryzae]